MRIFTKLVFDSTVRGADTKYFSSAEFNDLLGKADDVIYEVEVEETTGSPTSITVKHLHSNSGIGFDAASTVLNAASLSTLPLRRLGNTSVPLGALGQVEVSITGGSTPTARVGVWATGRSH
jgi:hypothetical protein